jgi:hypothetical protein
MHIMKQPPNQKDQYFIYKKQKTTKKHAISLQNIF